MPVGGVLSPAFQGGVSVVGGVVVGIIVFLVLFPIPWALCPCPCILCEAGAGAPAVPVVSVAVVVGVVGGVCVTLIIIFCLLVRVVVYSFVVCERIVFLVQGWCRPIDFDLALGV